MFELLKTLLEQANTIKDIIIKNPYKKGFKKHKHDKRVIYPLKKFIDLLKAGKDIPREFNDHALAPDSKLKGMRTAHIKGQQVVILYRIFGDTIELLNLGSHSEIGTK